MPRGRPKKNNIQEVVVSDKEPRIETVSTAVMKEEKVSVLDLTPSAPEEVKAATSRPLTAKERFEMEDRKIVTGVFHYLGKAGGVLRIAPMAKYKGDPLLVNETYIDGKEYTIPKWKADWMNGKPNEGKTPYACKCTHTDQYKDIQEHRVLAPPKEEPLYSFTPVAKW